MIVCLCEGVNDTKLRSAIEDGADTVRALCRRTKAGTHCGMCKCDIRSMLRERRATHGNATPQVMAAK